MWFKAVPNESEEKHREVILLAKAAVLFNCAADWYFYPKTIACTSPIFIDSGMNLDTLRSGCQTIIPQSMDMLLESPKTLEKLRFLLCPM